MIRLPPLLTGLTVLLWYLNLDVRILKYVVALDVDATAKTKSKAQALVQEKVKEKQKHAETHAQAQGNTHA